jgi:DNA polymerase III alpha subunit (gram-positive type)
VRAVVQELDDFVGDDPVVGHNVRFDLSFPSEKRYFTLQHNLLIHTSWLPLHYLANSRYNLGTLGLTPGDHDPQFAQGIG